MGSGENMNNAESLTVRLIIGHCGHRDGDGSMLSGHNFEWSWSSLWNCWHCLQATSASSISSLFVPFNNLTSPVSMMLYLSLLIVAAESKHCLHRVPAPTFILLSDNLLVVLIQNCLGGKQFLTEQDYRFNVSSSRIKQRDSPALLISMWRM